MSLLFQVWFPAALLLSCAFMTPCVAGGVLNPQVNNLPLGVKCFQKDKVHLASATFQIIVTMESPEVGILQREINEVRMYVNHANLTRKEKVVIFKQLAELEAPPPMLRWPDLDVPTGNLRVKRGLINVIGDLSYYLFGTARESDMNELKGYIKKCQENQKTLYMDLQNYVAVLNDSLSNIEVNRGNINRLSKALTNELSHVDLKLAIINSLMSLQTARYRQDTLVRHFVSAKLTLEEADLSEELFPAKYLEAIIKHAPVKLPLTWYYQNAKVQPVFAERERLVFIILLTLPGPETFLEYEIDTIPVSVGNITSELQLHHNIAFNTMTGKAFLINEDCVGVNPKVCMPALVTDQEYTCERDLLSGRSEVQTCPTLISSGTSLHVKKVDSSLLISTPGEIEMLFYCKGRQPHTERLPPGAFILKLPPNCKVQVGPYSYQTIMTYSIGVKTTWDTVNVSLQLDSEWVEKVHTIPLLGQKRVRLNKLQDLEVPGFLPSDTQTPSWEGFHIITKPWLSTVTATLIGVLVIFLLWKFSCCKRTRQFSPKCLCKKRLQDQPKEHASDVEDSGTTSAPVTGNYQLPDPQKVLMMVTNEKDQKPRCALLSGRDPLRKTTSDDTFDEVKRTFNEIYNAGPGTPLNTRKASLSMASKFLPPERASSLSYNLNKLV